MTVIALAANMAFPKKEGNKLDINIAKSDKSWQGLKAAASCCISQKTLTWKQVLLCYQLPLCFLYSPQVGQEEELFSDNRINKYDFRDLFLTLCFRLRHLRRQFFHREAILHF